MRARWPLLATFVLAGVGFVTAPYLTLYRLSEAVRGADSHTLEALVDWPSVREGIKEDICDLVVDQADGGGAAKLPPFGAGFMRGIASSTVDERVTPQAIVAAASVLTDDSQDSPRANAAQPVSVKAPAAKPPTDVHLEWAFFESPTVFMVRLRTQGVNDPIRIEMDLHNGEWQVRRVWLPEVLLSNNPART